jgi:catechol 2,3-dioxygenase-like lactoylglutathione lyase family enzyme
MNTHFYHVGLTVSDVERSFDFYREVIGLSLANHTAAESLPTSGAGGDGPSPFITIRSDAFDTLTHNPGCEVKYCYLQSDDGRFVLQLVQYTAGGGDAVELRHQKPGTPHMCFYVDSIEESRSELQRRSDVRITSEVVHFPPNLYNFYIEDPDGVPIEFIEQR